MQFEKSQLRIEADWKLNLNDYEISPPKLLVLKVDDVQTIRIVAILNKQD